MMASPHDGTTYTQHDQDWAATFFHKKPSHPPGTVFSYDTSATVILNTIVEKLSGMTFLEYMSDKLLYLVGFYKYVLCIYISYGTFWGDIDIFLLLYDMSLYDF